ncbi:MAG: hypothetical protein J4N87_06840 [Chloroflexi bacterium]|nr:hypothetical protein [Chloroflexota bacterium]
MGILSQLAPGIGDLFKLMVLTIMAITIGLLVMSMASSYEAMAMINLGIDYAGPINYEPILTTR